MFHRASLRRLAVAATVLVLALPTRVFAQTGTITGKVTDVATKQPIAEARVVLPGTAFQTQTTKDGEFRFTNVRPGSITVGAFRLGFKAVSDTVRVVAGRLRLQPSLHG